jgi:chromosomal replication initiator protein
MELIWSRAKSFIRDMLDTTSFKRWIEPIKYVSHLDGEIHLTCPNNFFREWIERHYMKIIKAGLKEAYGKDLSLRLEVIPNGEKHGNGDINYGQLRLPNIKSPRSLSLRINPNFTFDRFVVGPCNELAYSAAMTVARERTSRYTPLYFYADIGLGKSHLSCAIGNFILENFEGERVYYLSAEEFVNELIMALRNKRIDAFKEKYRKECDVLLIDGVHFLSGKEKTQKELTHTLDALYNSGKQVILTSNTLPNDLQYIEESLRSRLSCGLIVNIKPPDLETRKKILKAKISQEGINLEEEILDYIAVEIEGSVRKLESALINLIAKSYLMNCPIDMEMAREVVKCIVKKNENQITIDQIKKLVAHYFHLSPEHLESKSKKRSIVHPRHIAMYLCRTFTDYSLEAIGKAFNRDHASVIHSIAKIKKEMDEKSHIRKQIDYLKERIKG